MIERFTPIEIRLDSTIAPKDKIITTEGAIYPEFYDLSMNEQIPKSIQTFL